MSDTINAAEIKRGHIVVVAKNDHPVKVGAAKRLRNGSILIVEFNSTMTFGLPANRSVEFVGTFDTSIKSTEDVANVDAPVKIKPGISVTGLSVKDKRKILDSIGVSTGSRGRISAEHHALAEKIHAERKAGK